MKGVAINANPASICKRIYFGYPQAHEDDAERAVRAGLEIVAVTSW